MVAVPVSTPVRIRFGTEITGADPPSEAFACQWRPASGVWALLGKRILPTVLSVTPTSDNTDGTSVAVNMPATVNAGDLLIMLVSKDGTGAISDVTDWTALWASSSSGASNFRAFAKSAVGNEDGTTVSVSFGAASETAAAQVIRIQAGTWTGTIGDIQVGTTATGTSNSPNPPSVTPASTMVALAIACYGADDDDDASAYPYSDGTNTYTESGTGTASCSVGSSTTGVDTGSAVDPGTFTMAASEEWAAQTIIVPGALPCVELAASSHITASGENTTEQLTTTTGTFVGGRISDDENPADAVDVGEGVREDEFSIRLTGNAVGGVVYELRLVLSDGTAFDTYDVTPLITLAQVGSGTPSLPSLVASGAGDHTGAGAIEGDGAPTLPSLLSAGTGVMQPSGTGAPVAPSLVAAGAALHAQSASGAATLPGLTASGSGVMQPSGSGDPALGALSAAGTGVNTFPGSGAGTLGALTASGSAVMHPDGAGAPVLPGIGSAGVGVHAQAAAGDPTLPGLTASGAAVMVPEGDGASTLPSLLAAGTALMQPSGAGDPTLPSLVSGAEATSGFSSTGAATLSGLTASGSALMQPSGAGDPTLPGLTASGSALQTHAASGAPTLPPLLAAGVGLMPADGAGDATLPALLAAGSGAQVFTSSGDATLPALVADGAGEQASGIPEGDGDATLPGMTASGAGIQHPRGAGAGTLPGMSGSGSGFTPITQQPAAPVAGGWQGRGYTRQPEPYPLPAPRIASGGGRLAALGARGAGASVKPRRDGAVAAYLPGLTASGAAHLAADANGAVALPAMFSGGQGGVTWPQRPRAGTPILSGGGTALVTEWPPEVLERRRVIAQEDEELLALIMSGAI